MKPIWARPIRKEEVDQLKAWAERIKAINLWDESVLDYPTTFAITAEKSQRPILHVPVQRPLMLESLCPSPECSELDEALALREIVHTLVVKGISEGAGELWFGCKDPRVEKFAEAHGFEKVSFPMFRLRLNTLP